MNARGCWLACSLSLVAIVGSGCEQEKREYAAPVSAGPHRPAGRTADGGALEPGFTPRPSGSSSGAAPPAAMLSDLTADQVSALCVELDARFRARVGDEDAARFLCNLIAAQSSTTTDADGETLIDALACADAAASCLASPPGSSSAVDCSVLAGARKSCELEVRTFEQCFDAHLERIAAAVDDLACDALAAAADVDAVLATLDDAALPECEQVADACPALLPSGDGAGATMTTGDGCSDLCISARDDRCDDGGEGSASDTCSFGSDCTDCGPR